MNVAHPHTPRAVAFVAANPATHGDALVRLNVEYMTWVVEGNERHLGTSPLALLGRSIPDYVAAKLPSVCGATPPLGVFYLVLLDGEPAGMGGLRRLSDETAELKRVYVRPAHRGARLGARIVGRLLDDARAFGYRRVCLDSGPFMASAHRVYESAGFVDCPPYPEAEVSAALHDRWRFMVRPV